MIEQKARPGCLCCNIVKLVPEGSIFAVMSIEIAVLSGVLAACRLGRGLPALAVHSLVSKATRPIWCCFGRRFHLVADLTKRIC